METPRHSRPAPDTPTPILKADSLRLATGQGLVFDTLSVDIPRGALCAITGKAGAGKSALLLALTGRMQGVTGSLVVDGHDARRHPRRVRRATSVARIDTLIEPEASLSLEDCITERTLADAAPARARHANYLHVALLLGLDAPRDTLFGQLSPADQTRAAVALASIRPSRLIVVDDLDRETTLADQAALWAGLLDLAAEGVTVVASTSERAAVPPEVLTLEMDPRHG